MNLILKGIDPKTDYGLCILTIKGELITANGKHIQAIQLPKGHGRLIDKDELLSHLKKDPLFSLVEQYGISGVIESRPTIFEAEGEEDEQPRG